MTTETPIQNQKFQTRRVALLSGAHGVHDSYTSYLPILLPHLIEKFSLSNTSAGLLSVFLQMPSLINPLIGHIADRRNLRFFIILTPAITGAGMSLLSIAPSYAFIIFLLLIAGVSNAAIHAVAIVLTGTLSGNQLGKGMSFWMVGGELGRTLGPLILVSAITYLTYEGLPWLMLGGIFVSIFLYFQLKIATTIPHSNGTSLRWAEALRKMGPVMFPIFILLFSRAMMMATLTTFLPTFLTSEGATLWVAGASLSILEAAGVAGAFLAGTLSDRFGRRTYINDIISGFSDCDDTIFTDSGVFPDSIADLSGIFCNFCYPGIIGYSPGKFSGKPVVCEWNFHGNQFRLNVAGNSHCRKHIRFFQFAGHFLPECCCRFDRCSIYPSFA